MKREFLNIFYYFICHSCGGRNPDYNHNTKSKYGYYRLDPGLRRDDAGRVFILSLDNGQQFINNENIMKITIYTITECAFSKQEKEYLSAHGLQFEEKNLETNREFLTEMLAVGGNFAGTPVTKIEKDDGQIVVLKGFTAAEFDKTLGSTPKAAEPAVQAPVAEVAPQTVQATAPVPVEQPVVAAVPTPPAPVMPEVVAPAPTATAQDPAMASVLNTLEQQTAPPASVAPMAPQAPVVPAAQAPGAPVIPNPTF